MRKAYSLLGMARPGRGFKNLRDTACSCLMCAEVIGVGAVRAGCPNKASVRPSVRTAIISTLAARGAALGSDSSRDPREPGAGIKIAHSEDLARLGWARVGGECGPGFSTLGAFCTQRNIGWGNRAG